jgi:hypothetical protein
MERESKGYDLRDIRQSHSNAYSKWSEEEVSKLVSMFQRQVPVIEIARQLGRKEGAITNRLRKLALNGQLMNPAALGNSELALPSHLNLGCSICGTEIEINSSRFGSAQVWCSNCRCLFSDVNPSSFRDMVEQEVERKGRLLASGELKTRIQSNQQNDAVIDEDGMYAEIAATVVLCPNRLSDLLEGWKVGKNNRGKDLPMDWTGLNKPVEVKFTRWHSTTSGYLLLRPPSKTGNLMSDSFVDDAFYVLVTKLGQMFRLLGWVNRECFLSRKIVDPVGRTHRQLQCWGVHWSNLEAMKSFPLGRFAFFPAACSPTN